jgi:hypothetical protein
MGSGLEGTVDGRTVRVGSQLLAGYSHMISVRSKVIAFFDKLLDQQFTNKPFMRHYLDYYFDLYWDLHLGVSGDAVPFEVRQIGEAFNTVLAYRNPLLPITHDNYMVVREGPRLSEIMDR